MLFFKTNIMIIQNLSVTTNRFKAHNNEDVAKVIKENSDKICFPTLDGFLFIKISEISHFKSDDIYCRLYSADGTVNFIMRSLKLVEEQCTYLGFYRVHKSYLVNPYNILKHVNKEGGYLLMENKEHIPISRSIKKCLKKFLGVI